jgi:alkyl sulfatase BDS1-like metallo-beta-lactamase superfamily hydrolase
MIRSKFLFFSTVGASLCCLTLPANSKTNQPPVGVATPATVKANGKAALALPLNSPADMENARKGRLTQIPDGIIKNSKGEIVWDATSYSFLSGSAPATVNPSLWRQSQLNLEHGLFEVIPGIYQVRGYDVSVMTIIRGKNGWIIVDPLGAVESAAAGMQLVEKALGKRPVTAIIFTHSHGDHWAGVDGVASKAERTAQNIPVVAPAGFLKEAVSENLLAGAYMARRATYQFGIGLPRGPKGQVGTGLGQAAAANGTVSLAVPTMEIAPDSKPVVLDGVTFEFIDAPNTEAPSEFMFYLPEYRALCSSELATHTFHNVLTQRGAKVRDALMWSKSIDAILRRYGDKSDVVFGSHNWPTWGGGNLKQFLSNQRDIYRFVHDQTIRLANTGETATEIAEEIGEPEFTKSDFSVRGYYGTLNHNSKAVFQNYFGWWDGVPANYNPHPPAEESKRYVAAMGGARKALASGIKAFGAGDYRWSSKLFQHIVFADPENDDAKAWLASSYEQQGFQSEAGTWRNLFLKAAQELRDGVAAPTMLNVSAMAAVIEAIPTDSLLDTIATRYNPETPAQSGAVIQFIFKDRNEYLTFHVRDSVLVPRMGEKADNPTVTLTTTRTAFNRLLADPTSINEAIAAGNFVVTGNQDVLKSMFQALGSMPTPFNIVTP